MTAADRPFTDIPVPGVAHNGPDSDIPRPSVTDDARAAWVEAGRRYPNSAALAGVFVKGTEWAQEQEQRQQEDRAAGRAETPAGLTVSEDGAVLNWQGVNYVPQRAETTTEDAQAAVIDALGQSPIAHHETIPSGETTSTLSLHYDDDWDVLASLIVQMLTARDLLATARTRPTRYEVARAIRLSRTNGLCKPGVRCDLCDCAQEYEDDLALRDADAVLALWADQPTEAEAGARALEQAAEQTYTKSNAQWLRDRAASLRGGER